MCSDDELDILVLIFANPTIIVRAFKLVLIIYEFDLLSSPDSSHSYSSQISTLRGHLAAPFNSISLT